LRRHFLTPAHEKRHAIYRAAKALVTVAGEVHPDKLTAAEVIEACDVLLTNAKSRATRYNYVSALRHILHDLTEMFGTPQCSQALPRPIPPRPRNVTLTEEERDKVLNAASPHMRLWLLLCSDLALRSGTAAFIGPRHYNPATKEITFTTKYDERLTLPVTQAIADLFDKCDHQDPTPYTMQLHRAKQKQGPKVGHSSYYANSLRRDLQILLTSVGLKRNLRAHDLRRTTAVAMLEATRDIRAVQALLGHTNLASTFWYLDHNATPVKRATLELIKRPNWRKEKIA
jgi:integrase/recombinase XerC